MAEDKNKTEKEHISRAPQPQPQTAPIREVIEKNTKLRKILLCICAVLILAALICEAVNPGFLDGIYTNIYGEDAEITQQFSQTAAQIDSSTKIHFVDSGQGDCVIIEQNGHYAMVDSSISASEADIFEYLRENNIEKLDLLIMTHPHADHIGSMRAVVNQIEIGMIIMPDLSKGQTSDTVMFQKLLKAINDKKIKTAVAVEGDEYALGDGVITIIMAGADNPTNLNNTSTVFMFEANGFRYLSTGDGEAELEADLLARNYNLRADVYKAAHHGSSTSNTMDFLKAVSPSVIVASCGLENDYGHPHKEVLERILELHVAFYRTDKNGNIIVYPTENGVGVVCEKEEAA